MGSRAFLYGRHSTDKQELTEDMQKSLCMRYFEQELKPKGVTLASMPGWPGGWYYDPAVSSGIAFSERTVGRVVMLSLQPGDHLVVAKMSRPFRSVRDGENTIEQLNLRDVRVHALDMPVDTQRAHGRFVRRVYMAADQLWREVAREAALETVAHRKSNGLPYSKSIPIGWKLAGQPPHRVWRVDAQERALAERIAGLYASGMSLDNIALWGMRQKEIENKRQFTHRDAVKWVLNARSIGYPKICGYKAVRREVRLRQV